MINKIETKDRTLHRPDVTDCPINLFSIISNISIELVNNCCVNDVLLNDECIKLILIVDLIK
jgi:hypothetical protein